MSTWPEISAATRVASLPMTENSTSSTLCSGLSHQFGFFTSTVFTSASRLLSMNGPVPIALRVAKFSSLLGQVGRAGRAVLLRPRLRHDRDLRQLVGIDRVRIFRLNFDREIVDLADFLERGEVAAHVRPVAVGADQREHHVVGREGRAVMPLHVRAQLEAPDGRDGVAPLLCEGAFQLELLVAPHQRLVDVVGEAQQERLVPRMRIHRVHIAVIGEAECLGVDRPR